MAREKLLGAPKELSMDRIKVVTVSSIVHEDHRGLPHGKKSMGKINQIF